MWLINLCPQRHPDLPSFPFLLSPPLFPLRSPLSIIVPRDWNILRRKNKFWHYLIVWLKCEFVTEIDGTMYLCGLRAEGTHFSNPTTPLWECCPLQGILYLNSALKLVVAKGPHFSNPTTALWECCPLDNQIDRKSDMDSTLQKNRVRINPINFKNL